MPVLDKIMTKAKSDIKKIVLPEGSDPRVVEAAVTAAKDKVADIIVIGSPEEIAQAANGADLSLITVIDPMTSEKTAEYAKAFYELRKHKGISEQQAYDQILDPVFYGTMMVKLNDADGLVSGAQHTTGETILPGLQIVRRRPDALRTSSFFIMESDDPSFGDNGVLIFADCAVMVDPTAEQLVSIASLAADSAKTLAGLEPRVAMLSYSTKGSAEGECADKMAKATQLLKENYPEITVDGELQADAALVEEVGASKCPGSEVAGKANVLIFPDLQSGNIGYKLVQRLAKVRAIGPVLQGMAKPINDLSRGCSAEDIVHMIAITAVQAQNI